MKIIFSLMLLTSFAAKATPVMTMKERLRIHLWAYGINEKPVKKKMVPAKTLPEEIERPLRKI